MIEIVRENPQRFFPHTPFSLLSGGVWQEMRFLKQPVDTNIHWLFFVVRSW